MSAISMSLCCVERQSQSNGDPHRVHDMMMSRSSGGVIGSVEDRESQGSLVDVIVMTLRRIESSKEAGGG